MNENGQESSVKGDVVIFKLSQQIASLVTQLAIKDAALDEAYSKIQELENGSRPVEHSEPS